MAVAGHLALAQPVEAPTGRALDDLGVLVFGDHSEHLKGELVFGIVGVVLSLDDDLLAALEQLFDDDRLVRNHARNTVGVEEVDHVVDVPLRVRS
jgi:hypothetical protein